MKNFDLEAAKRGAAVCTKCVMDVRIICFDRIDSLYPIVGLCRNNDGSEFVGSYTTDGRKFCSTTDDRDLMMRDDDYLEKLERGEYYIEDKREIVDPTIKQNLNTDREYWRRVYAGQAMQGIRPNGASATNLPPECMISCPPKPTAPTGPTPTRFWRTP